MFNRFYSTKPSKDQLSENKRLLRNVNYVFTETDLKDLWNISAYEQTTGASVDILVNNSEQDLSVDYTFAIPNTPQNFKLYIIGIFAGESKGIVRVMLCQLLMRALLKFKDFIKPSTRAYLNACGKGPTGNYIDLIRMYRNMGFEPCGTDAGYPIGSSIEKIQQALANPEKFNDKLFMGTLNCQVYLQQSISKLMRWCVQYYY